MSLKEQVAIDNETVFMNEDDFAEEHDLNGTVCKAVVQGELTQKRPFKVGAVYDDVYAADIVVHVKKDYLSEVPVRDEVFHLDGESYIVEKCTDDMGILTIELGANRG